MSSCDLHSALTRHKVNRPDVVDAFTVDEGHAHLGTVQDILKLLLTKGQLHSFWSPIGFSPDGSHRILARKGSSIRNLFVTVNCHERVRLVFLFKYRTSAHALTQQRAFFECRMPQLTLACFHLLAATGDPDPAMAQALMPNYVEFMNAFTELKGLVLQAEGDASVFLNLSSTSAALQLHSLVLAFDPEPAAMSFVARQRHMRVLDLEFGEAPTRSTVPYHGDAHLPELKAFRTDNADVFTAIMGRAVEASSLKHVAVGSLQGTVLSTAFTVALGPHLKCLELELEENGEIVFDGLRRVAVAFANLAELSLSVKDGNRSTALFTKDRMVKCRISCLCFARPLTPQRIILTGRRHVCIAAHHWSTRPQGHRPSSASIQGERAPTVPERGTGISAARTLGCLREAILPAQGSYARGTRRLAKAELAAGA